jgi:hypothetical protein
VARKPSPTQDPAPKPPAAPVVQSSIELTLQEELAIAKKEGVCEEFAINRTYRRVALSSLTGALKGGLGDERLDLGVLTTIVRAAELHAFTMVLLAFDVRSVTFVRQGINDVTIFLQWCHAYFGQVTMMAPSMPAPASGTDGLMKILSANTAEIHRLLEHLADSSKFSEDEGGQPGGTEAGGDACEDAVTFTLTTFTALANALMSVIRAWLPATTFLKFNEAYSAGLLELTDLRHLMASSDEPDEPEASEAAAGTDGATK